MGYAARGPIAWREDGDGSLDRAAIEAFTSRVRTVGHQHRLGVVRIEPEAGAGGSVEDDLRRAGWRPAPHVQPESTRIIDLGAGEEAVRAGLHRKCRQSIAKSGRLGVRITEGDALRLELFHAIHADALRRAGIVPREIRTYRRMWEELQPRGMARLLFAEDAEGSAVATLFLVSCGPRVVDLYGGTTPDGGRLRANYLLKWEAIRSSMERGFREYDLWGLPREGIATFKSGFGGREVRYVGAWELGVDRLGQAVLRAGQATLGAARRWRRGRARGAEALEAAAGSEEP
jgi:lipid II:glycine glycyltransferase (peptidoglycan interpeptide bridge formation enzyme)